ncbi:MAG: TPM domain-containing protein [Candidatus Eisenbacteria sp.]|nr:TPM domain-containing protein [Candidatus Eisenbacteria bacterium]
MSEYDAIPRGSRKRPERNGVIYVISLLAALGILLLSCCQDAWAISGSNGRELVMGDLRIPPPTGYVNDFAQVMTRAQRLELEDLCRRLDRASGAQLALVILPSVEREPITEVKNRLFEAWQVGRKSDDRGLLIVHALSERRIEVEVGYGLEPILPDARVGALLDQAVMPLFKEGRFFEGYRSGIAAFGQRILADPNAKGGSDAYRRGGRPSSGQSGGGSRRFPIGGLLLVPVFLYLLIRHPRLLLLLLIMNMGGSRRGGGLGGSFGGGFGGFGGGMSGGGGAGRSY